MRSIVVAAQNIPRGTRITEENNAVKMMSWPEASVPAGALTELESTYDLIARMDIVLDMPITEGMLTAEIGDLADVGSDVALMTPSGRVAYALPVARWSSVAWALQPGDRVDVLITLLLVDLDEEYQTILPNRALVPVESVGPEGEVSIVYEERILGRLEVQPDGTVVTVLPGESSQRPRMVAQLTVQDAIVIGVGDWREEPPPPPPPEGTEEEGPPPPPPLPDVESVTLAVTPQDALVLKYAEELGASMDMVLRSADDAGRFVTTESVTLQYLFDRFGMEVPAKVPYGVTPPVRTLRRGTTGELPTTEVESRVEE